MHQSVEGYSRRIMSDLEERYNVSLPLDHHFIPWLFRHVPWMMDRFVKAPKSHLTPYELHKGRPYKSPVVQFGETVMWKDPGPHNFKLREKFGKGIWLGRSEVNNAHMILTRSGAFEGRTTKRLPPSERADVQLLLAARGFPWKLKPEEEELKAVEDRPSGGGGALPPIEEPSSVASASAPAVVLPPPLPPPADQVMDDVQGELEGPPAKRGRGRIATGILPLPGSAEFTPGCSGCMGISYYHNKACRAKQEEAENIKIVEIMNRT